VVAREDAGVPALTSPRSPGIAWSWPAALVGAVCAIPAIVVMPFDVPSGLALAFGVLPAAIIGVAPVRRERVRVVLLGSLMGVPIFVGSLLSGEPALAVASIVVLAIGAAMLSTRPPLGPVIMTISLPMIGIGFSYHDVGEGLGLALLVIAGSTYAFVVSLLWPERAVPPAAHEPVAPGPPPRSMIGYGLRLGLAGATAATIGFALDFDHVGWATAAAMLVMRPSAEMQRLRSVGRVVSVVVGALAAAALARLTTAPGWYSVAMLVVLAGIAATRPSRWYVTPTFTTFIAISMLLYANPDDAQSRFNERVGETLLGVALAYVFGLLVPWVGARLRDRA
jgi:Fusaric acid resistance protein-like